MKTLFRAAAELERFLVKQGWRYCFIGGLRSSGGASRD